MLLVPTLQVLVVGAHNNGLQNQYARITCVQCRLCNTSPVTLHSKCGVAPPPILYFNKATATWEPSAGTCSRTARTA